MHLAELNISTWKIDPYSEAARGFVSNVDLINSLAERTAGFIWRLEDEGRDKEGRNAVCRQPQTEMTLSVWDSAESLDHFVWNTVHKQIYNGKQKWFAKPQSHHLVMWWIEEGHRPSVAEAKERMDHLDQYGNSAFAFDWSYLPEAHISNELSKAPSQATNEIPSGVR